MGELKVLELEGEHPSSSAYGRSVGDPARQVIWMYGGTTYNYSFSDMKMDANLWCYVPDKNKWENSLQIKQGLEDAQVIIYGLMERNYIFLAVLASIGVFTVMFGHWI